MLAMYAFLALVSVCFMGVGSYTLVRSNGDQAEVVTGFSLFVMAVLFTLYFTTQTLAQIYHF